MCCMLVVIRMLIVVERIIIGTSWMLMIMGVCCRMLVIKIDNGDILIIAMIQDGNKDNGND